MPTSPFQQPAWDEASGQPYPGAEQAAAVIAADAEAQQVQALAKTEKLRAKARRRGQRAADEEDQQLRRVVARRASTVTPKRVRWLWDQRIPLGELTLIAGKGSVGKSTLACTLCGWITRGDMNGEFKTDHDIPHSGTPCDVLYVVNEDSIECTVVPRLIAAGADLDRVHFIGIDMAGRGDRLILPTDCEQIEAYAREVGAVAVILDPLSSNVRGKRNEADDIRPVMEALRAMCERCGMAAIGLAHTRKGQSSDLMEAIMGSSEFGNVCRSAMGVMVDPDEDDTIVLSQEKSNLGRHVTSYKYRVVNHSFVADGEFINIGKLEFLGKTDQTVSDMLSEVGSPRTKEAASFIRDYLTDNGGEALRTDVISAALKEKLAQATVERAAQKMRLKIDRERKFQGGTIWRLPE